MQPTYISNGKIFFKRCFNSIQNESNLEEGVFD